MRTPVVAGNWKMNLDRARALALVQALREKAGSARAEVGVAPSYPYLVPVGEALKGSRLFLAAQDLDPEPYGAFTGQVSGPMLKDVGCTHVIVGHSERRHGMGEDDAAVARKLRAAPQRRRLHARHRRPLRAPSPFWRAGART